ncbi:MAG: thioredoxin domain-containing protein [Candidatus Rokubacteria bacterium]|nr:thioredoxin domain-containing protein [Candidatus Rokubacteria bacterium]
MGRALALGLAILAALMFWASPHARALSPDGPQALRRELESLEQGQAANQRELRARPVASAPAVLRVRADGAAALGEQGARVVLIEFSDYQCPFCARHARQTLPLLKQEYIDTGKVRYVFRDFPIATIHRDADPRAVRDRARGPGRRSRDAHGSPPAGGSPADRGPRLDHCAARAGDSSPGRRRHPAALALRSAGPGRDHASRLSRRAARCL